MKSNNNRAVAINSQKLDELYKEWSGEHHTTNSNKPVHDSAECCDFAEYCLKYGMDERKAKANTKNSVLHIFSVVFSFLCGGKKKPKQTCKNCRFNCEDDHTCMNDCNVGSYYAEKGLNRICYEGELWEGK